MLFLRYVIQFSSAGMNLMLKQKKGPALAVALAKEFVASTELSPTLVEGTERSTMGEAPIESAPHRKRDIMVR